MELKTGDWKKCGDVCECKKVVNIRSMIESCGKTTIEKGFDCSQHLKQIMLMADECFEALEHIAIGTETHPELLQLYNNIFTNFKIFKSFRKNIDLKEETIIKNKVELTEELADIIIRVFSYSFVNNLELVEAIEKKIEKNKNRPVLHGQKF